MQSAEAERSTPNSMPNSNCIWCSDRFPAIAGLSVGRYTVTLSSMCLWCPLLASTRLHSAASPFGLNFLLQFYYPLISLQSFLLHLLWNVQACIRWEHFNPHAAVDKTGLFPAMYTIRSLITRHKITTLYIKLLRGFDTISADGVRITAVCEVIRYFLSLVRQYNGPWNVDYD